MERKRVSVLAIPVLVQEQSRSSAETGGPGAKGCRRRRGVTAFSLPEDTSPIKEGGELGPIDPCLEVGRPPSTAGFSFPR